MTQELKKELKRPGTSGTAFKVWRSELTVTGKHKLDLTRNGHKVKHISLINISPLTHMTSHVPSTVRGFTQYSLTAIGMHHGTCNLHWSGLYVLVVAVTPWQLHEHLPTMAEGPPAHSNEPAPGVDWKRIGSAPRVCDNDDASLQFQLSDDEEQRDAACNVHLSAQDLGVLGEAEDPEMVLQCSAQYQLSCLCITHPSHVKCHVAACILPSLVRTRLESKSQGMLMCCYNPNPHCI